MRSRRIVISGCSGGGKSSVIEALSARGFATMPEAGRILVREEMAARGDALPWADPVSFAKKLLDRAITQFESAPDGDVFYDRSVIDPVAFLDQHKIAVSPEINAAILQCQYHNPVFIVPPWGDIYVNDPERPKSFEEAVSEFEPLLGSYRNAGYRLIEIPQIPVQDRVAFILENL